MSDTGEKASGVRGLVRGFIVKRFPVAQERQLGDEDSLLDSGAIDSLGILDVVAFLEEEFEFQLDDDELAPEHFDSIASLAKLVESKLG